jgi:hypothetical protein
MEIRSYRRVFDLERRVYRIDRLRLNPGGVPLRGVAYFLVILVLSLMAGRLAPLGALIRALPWYLRDLLLPGAGAALLSVVSIEGRPFHLAAHALLRHRAGPRWLSGLEGCVAAGWRWSPEEIVILPDGSDGRLRRLRYTGPGAVLVAVEHELRSGRTAGRDIARGWPGRRPAVVVGEPDGHHSPRCGEVIALAPGARLLVRTASDPEGER